MARIVISRIVMARIVMLFYNSWDYNSCHYNSLYFALFIWGSGTFVPGIFVLGLFVPDLGVLIRKTTDTRGRVFWLVWLQMRGCLCVWFGCEWEAGCVFRFGLVANEGLVVFWRVIELWKWANFVLSFGENQIQTEYQADQNFSGENSGNEYSRYKIPRDENSGDENPAGRKFRGPKFRHSFICTHMIEHTSTVDPKTNIPRSGQPPTTDRSRSTDWIEIPTSNG